MERVKAYVDGFNLYHGMHERYGRRYLWLDLEHLAGSLLRPTQTLIGVDYFTARVRRQPDAAARQGTYLSALRAHCRQLDIIEGRFQEKSRQCFGCGASWLVHEEKETDVSIAAALIEDAVNDVFDVALLLSADSDLCPAVRTVGRLRPGKGILAVFPPRRHSDDLRRAVNRAAFTLGQAKIRHAQLPETVITATGAHLTRPSHWK